MSGRLADKVVFITGAASGIGRATADAVRAEGGVVAAADLTPPEGLGNRDIALRLDVTDRTAMADAVNHIMKHYGRLDGLVTCAGISVAGPRLPLLPLGRGRADRRAPAGEEPPPGVAAPPRPLGRDGVARSQRNQVFDAS